MHPVIYVTIATCGYMLLVTYKPRGMQRYTKYIK